MQCFSIDAAMPVFQNYRPYLLLFHGRRWPLHTFQLLTNVLPSCTADEPEERQTHVENNGEGGEGLDTSNLVTSKKRSDKETNVRKKFKWKLSEFRKLKSAAEGQSHQSLID